MKNKYIVCERKEKKSNGKMLQKIILSVAIFCVAFSEIGGDATSKVVCMYDSRSFVREGKHFLITIIFYGI